MQVELTEWELEAIVNALGHYNPEREEAYDDEGKEKLINAFHDVVKKLDKVNIG